MNNFPEFYFNETLDTKVDTDIHKTKSGYSSVFIIDDHNYRIMFLSRSEELDLDNDIFEISFWRDDVSIYDSLKILNDTQNSLKVFGAIANIIKKWIDKENPQSFFFSAKEKSRIRLYDRFAKMISQLTDYQFDNNLNKYLKKMYADDMTYYSFSKRIIHFLKSNK